MFKMRPVFVVAQFAKPYPPPRMAIVEAVLRVVDGDGYLCRVVAVPWLPIRVCETFVRLEGVSVPEGGEPDFQDKVWAEAAKDFVARRVQEARMVTLRDFRRDKAGRLLANVHVDGDNLAALLVELAQAEKEAMRGRT